MNKTVIITIIALLVALVIALACTEEPKDTEVKTETVSARVDTVYSFDDLLDAMEWVESKGDVNAVGDGGKAVGCLQIWKIYVDDVNRIKRQQWDSRHESQVLEYKYSYRDNRSLSRAMATIYMEYYASTKRLGREPTFEDMAKIHVGGPNGYKKECTEPYWAKVLARMEASNEAI